MNNAAIEFHDLHPASANLKREAIAGLSAQPKTLSPKFFYDETGSALFHRITELPEYYPTRTEIRILRQRQQDIAAFLGEDCLLFEVGSGSDTKIRVLLDGLRPRVYVPMDISREWLRSNAEAIAKDYPEVIVHATCVDYSSDFTVPSLPTTASRAAFFPGSSIGNFEPADALRLLQRIAHLLGPSGALLIGVDLKKDAAILTRAYNDADGVTAAFNLNILARLNRELGADFALHAFRHDAWYNAVKGRIEMHLISERDQRVHIDDHRFHFAAGESIHTENSYKYAVDDFQQLAARAGFRAEEVWLDDDALFAVHCLRVGNS